MKNRLEKIIESIFRLYINWTYSHNSRAYYYGQLHFTGEKDEN